MIMMMMAMIIMGLVLGYDKMIDSVVVVTECTKAFWWHSMEYSLVIDSDWQQSFPRHMLQWVPWWRYFNRWQIFNCWWFITPSTSPPPVIKECTEGSLRITCPSFCLSIISYQSSHYHSTPPPPEENDWRKCYLLPWPQHSFRTYNV